MPEYCEKLINHMAEGYSFESFAGLVGVSRRTIYNWEAHPKFKEAKEIGFEKCRLFWERLGIVNIISDGETKQSLNTGAWIYNMKVRFPEWRADGPLKDEDKNDLTPRDQAVLDELAKESSEFLKGRKAS